MRYFLFLVFAVIVSSGATYLAAKSAVAEIKTTAAVADEANGVVRIMVEGKEVARFTSGGLDVRNDVRFGGLITDIGPDGFESGATGAQ